LGVLKNAHLVQIGDVENRGIVTTDLKTRLVSARTQLRRLFAGIPVDLLIDLDCG
jgi:hypothetical protein